MEAGREGHSGLYTMHFSNIFPPEEASAEGTTSSPSGTATTTTTTTAASSSSSVGPLAQFTNWHVLIRMNVENDVCFVKGDAKVFSPTPSLCSPSARGVNRDGTPVSPTTAPDGIPIASVYQKNRPCHVLIEGTLRQPDGLDAGPSAFRLQVHFDTLEGAVLGLSEPAELHNVMLSCSGFKACGWHMGTCVVTADDRRVQPPPSFRFLLKPYYGKRCTTCLDPVYAVGYTCDECEATHYCSRDCMNTHMKRGHGLLCATLRDQYRYRSGHVATEVSDETGMVAWWRCLDDGEYTILVDQHNPLGKAVEFSLCSLRSARESGVRYRFISDGTPAASSASSSGGGEEPSEEDVIDFSCVLMREVNRSAVLEGCAPLSAACLDHLYVFSPSTEVTIQAHILFFNAFHCEELSGPVSTVEEYVAYARPLHALASLQVEYALKSAISCEFWRRIIMAKDAVIALFTVNASCTFGAAMEEMRSAIHAQQCETLVLLSKVFVVMASRAPAEEGRQWLEQGEKYMRQCCCSDGARNDPYLHGTFCFRLAAFLLLFKDEEKNAEARELRQEGEKYIREARAMSEKPPSEDDKAPPSRTAEEEEGEKDVQRADPTGTEEKQQSGKEDGEEAAAVAANA